MSLYPGLSPVFIFSSFPDLPIQKSHFSISLLFVHITNISLPTGSFHQHTSIISPIFKTLQKNTLTSTSPHSHPQLLPHSLLPLTENPFKDLFMLTLTSFHTLLNALHYVFILLLFEMSLIKVPHDFHFVKCTKFSALISFSLPESEIWPAEHFLFLETCYLSFQDILLS